MRAVGPGDVVAGKYRVERILGEGGMGIVLGAQHVTHGERVALKMLKPEALADGEARARFVREARAAARMKGDHVARVLDVESPEDGLPFIAMEYLEGTDLAALVEEQGVLPVHVAVDFVLQACEALAEAHVLGIVHRDVKPSNLFLTRAVDGSPLVKVLDFGISKATSALDALRPDFDMTATHSVLGSPAYMAPEQMRSAKRVDGRTDIWAVGTILHELLTAHPPFEAKTMPELCAMILQDPAPPLRARRSDVPDGLEAVVARCLAKSPDDRFATIHDLAAALAPFGGPGARDAAARIDRIARPASSLEESDPRIAIGSTPRGFTADSPTIRAAAPPATASARRQFLWALGVAALVTLVGAAALALALRSREATGVAAPVTSARSTASPDLSGAVAEATTATAPSVSATSVASAPPPAPVSSPRASAAQARPTTRTVTTAPPSVTSTLAPVPAPATAPTPATTASSRYD